MMYHTLIFSADLAEDAHLNEVINALNSYGYKVIKLHTDTALAEQLTELTAADKALFIGTETILSIKNSLAAKSQLDFGLAVWKCNLVKHVQAKFYFRQPYDILNLLTSIEAPYKNLKWLSTAMEMQFIAQAGLTYSKDVFDRERFGRLRDMATEIMSDYTELPVAKVKDLFCNETGYQTPKLDTRSAIIKDDKILLVKELDGKWSLPGGWVDVNQSICDNMIKEAQEEAGLNVVPTRLVAVHDRNRHNQPLFAYGIIKVFMLCDIVSGHFAQNSETSDSQYFSLAELPPLSISKNTKEQIELCFAAAKDSHWIPVID